VVAADLMERARAGDDQAFGELVDRYRRELHVLCFRFLGSTQDAEDALQETLLAAWQGLGGFEERSSLRTWLYRIATSRCLNALRTASRRPQLTPPALPVEPPEPTRMGEVVWLEPYPDVLLTEITDGTPGPEARYESREAISLAFVTALQLLPPRQRAVLILRDVLGFRAGDVADILETTEQSVTSALKRARAAVGERMAPSTGRRSPPRPNSAVERAVVDRLTRAYETGDLDAMVALLTDDVLLAMPPVPLEYQGREVTTRFFATVAFRDGRTFRLIETRANGQPAFGVYTRERNATVLHANGLLVLELAGERICTMTRFDNSVLPAFGLPRTLPG
jgi:RNA polymerase sigma-70 factor (TIGR02960 family)